MRSSFPTSLEEDDIFAYIRYLGVVGGIFVIVALFLYVTLIAVAIASKKWKRFSTERVMAYHELHRRKGHILFIIINIFVFFLVVTAVIFGLVENSRLHDNVVKIAVKPTTIITPTAQVVINVNETVTDTGNDLDDSLEIIQNVLNSVASVSETIDTIYNGILFVQKQFDAVEDGYNSASGALTKTEDSLNELVTYQDEGYISYVPDTSPVQAVNDTISSTLNTANDFLDSTLDTITDALITVNTSIADAVREGNQQLSRVNNTLRNQIEDLQGMFGQAVDSLRGPNSTIADISELAIKYTDILEKVLIVIFVFGLVPLILVFIGLTAKKPLLYKFAFGLSFLSMFWLMAAGGVFAVVHTAFSQACDSREQLVINGIHKFTPEQYVINLGRINIGQNTIGEDTEIVISLNSTNLQRLLECADPTNFFDVFELSNLINSVFNQIYAVLDQLQAEQAEFFQTENPENWPTNFNSQIGSTTEGVDSFQNATEPLTSGSHLDEFNSLTGEMSNITTQTSNLATNAGNAVDSALANVNDVTRNVTTLNGDQYSFFYTIANVSALDPNGFPYDQTAPDYQDSVRTAKDAIDTAIDNRGSIIDKVNAINDVTNSVLDGVQQFQNFVSNTLGVRTDVNDTINDIQRELNRVANLVPEIYKNITAAIDSVRHVLDKVSDSLRSDTQCGFAGSFYDTFSAQICRTAKRNAQAMCAALLIMGIGYFFLCILGVSLLKRRDVHRLMEITEKGLHKLASIRVIDRTVSMVNGLVRSTSEFIRPREASSRNLHVPKEGNATSLSGEHPGTVIADDSEIRTATVRFSESPYVAGESPAPPPIERNNSLARITSALRVNHRRTLSNPLAHGHEIPYTELDEMGSPSTSSPATIPPDEEDKI